MTRHLHFWRNLFIYFTIARLIKVMIIMKESRIVNLWIRIPIISYLLPTWNLFFSNIASWLDVKLIERFRVHQMECSKIVEHHMCDDYYFNIAICLSGVYSALVWYVEKMIMVVVGLWCLTTWPPGPLSMMQPLVGPSAPSVSTSTEDHSQYNTDQTCFIASITTDYCLVKCKLYCW